MNEEVQQEKQLTESEVRAFIAAAGLNSLARAYDSRSQIALNSYIQNNTEQIIELWNLLDTTLKLKVIDANQEKILNLMRKVV